MKKILIMAGGTGGHIFPALVVAQKLQETGWALHWLGTERGLEKDMVPRAQIPISYIQVGGLRGKGWRKWLLAPVILLRALSQAIKVLHYVQPDVVLGMGGFVSGPGGVAAWLLRKPLVIHEQNAAAGLTNRLLAKVASRVLQAFPDTFPGIKAITVGNPVRRDISYLPPPDQRFAHRQGRLRLLVLGGSQGALIINQVLPEALAQLASSELPEVWHQSGKDREVVLQQSYQRLNLTVRIEPFIHDMAAAFQWADLVLCRAGASTLTELAAVGLGSILIPYPHAVDNHQQRNAEYLANVGAAVILPQSEFCAASLVRLLRSLLSDRVRLLAMATAAKQMNFVDAAQKVAQECQRLARLSKEELKNNTVNE